MTISLVCMAAAAAVCGAGERGAPGEGVRATFADLAQRLAARSTQGYVERQSGNAGAPENPGGSPAGSMVFAVTNVHIRDAGGGQMLATGIITPFGKSGVRPPEMVVDGPQWAMKTIKPRASLAMTDLNFATAPELPEEGVREAATLFNRGYRMLYPGPDMFIFDGSGRANGVRVSPIFRTKSGDYVEGEPVVIDVPTGAGRVEVAGREVFGVGIDLDEWAAQGAAPEGAMLAGAVIRHDGKGAVFSPVKILMADGEVIGLRGMAQPSFNVNSFATGGGGFGGGGGFSGGGGGISGGATEVPAPTGACVLLGAMGVAAVRRERR